MARPPRAHFPRGHASRTSGTAGCNRVVGGEVERGKISRQGESLRLRDLQSASRADRRDAYPTDCIGSGVLYTPDGYLLTNKVLDYH
jgi:hypothetical protein